MKELSEVYKSKLIHFVEIYKKLVKVQAPFTRWRRNYEKFMSVYDALLSLPYKNEELENLIVKYELLKNKFEEKTTEEYINWCTL